MNIHVRSSRRARRVTAAVLAGAALSAGISITPAWAPTCGSSCANSGPPVQPPTSKTQCKDGGWQTFTDAQRNAAFKNQGDCVSFVQNAQHVRGDQNDSQAAQFPTNPG